ncbi:mechanosensitive ion channel [Stieleria sp. JC731]|uniref:mechanosensitive ion channel family protein n=1 Tax=Pirellulaceae TaxID=2691357 RepID=UPI001E5A856A|nr:mechanosensitive ion channel family protein [Stieleria sp. JC731]MCC9602069.1 mechanosensitive ion channel [Stieleria sp. JC731]
MTRPRRLPIAALLFTYLLFPLASYGQEAESNSSVSGSLDEYIAVTTANPDVPIDQLQIMARPLTKSELQVEADAWFKLLRAKAAQVAAVRLGAKKATAALSTNNETEAANTIREAESIVEKASEKAEQTEQEITEEAAAETGEIADPSDPPDLSDDVTTSETIEAAAVSDSTAPSSTASAEDETSIVDPSQSSGSNESNDEDSTSEANSTEESSTTSNSADAVAATVRDNLLDNVSVLQDERTALGDRLEVILDSLELKGGDAQEYRDYVNAISGIELDTSDVKSAWSGMIGWLRSKEGGQRWAWNFVRFIVILLVTWLIAKIVARIVNWLLDRKIRLSQLAERLISQTVKNAVLAIGFAVALTALEIDITPIVAAIGATGLVIGLALQGTLSNFASGLMILINRPFDVGHVVSAGGITGTIDQMNLVSTRFRTFDNQTIYVPNNEIWNNVITNITANENRRVDMEFGIGYDDDFELAEDIIKDVVKNHELVLSDPEPAVVTHALADSSVNIVCRPWAKTSDWWTVKTDVTRAVKKRFDEAGISIPYPQQDVHIHRVLPKTSKDSAR